MKFIILGAAAGGGLPQWHCGCVNCKSARTPCGLQPQTQSSLAVSLNGDDWAILNASPDIRQQLERQPALHPTGLRGSPIRSVLVTNGDIDHLVGLLTLRESQPFDLFVTAPVAAVLQSNSIFSALWPQVRQHVVELEGLIPLLPGLEARVFAVPGKIPLYLEQTGASLETEDETTVGTELSSAGARSYYIPGCRDITAELSARLDGADALFFDGTVYHDDEMLRLNVSSKTGLRMGHMPITGDSGSLKRLAPLAIGRKIYVHINNTNPIWQMGPERQDVIDSGMEIAADGMEIKVGQGSIATGI